MANIPLSRKVRMPRLRAYIFNTAVLACVMINSRNVSSTVMISYNANRPR